MIVSAVLFLPVNAAFGDDAASEIDNIVVKWTQSLRNEDIDGFRSGFWDDAVQIVYFPGQEPKLVEGLDNLGVTEKAPFDEMDFQSMNLLYDEPVRFFPVDGKVTYIYQNSRFSFMDVFEFEKRGREFRIIEQNIFPHPSEE